MGYRKAIKKTYSYLKLQRQKTSANKRLKKYKDLLKRTTNSFKRVATPLNKKIASEKTKITKINTEIKKL
jgi:hypothetical protein